MFVRKERIGGNALSGGSGAERVHGEREREGEEGEFRKIMRESKLYI